MAIKQHTTRSLAQEQEYARGYKAAVRKHGALSSEPSHEVWLQYCAWAHVALTLQDEDSCQKAHAHYWYWQKSLGSDSIYGEITQH